MKEKEERFEGSLKTGVVYFIHLEALLHVSNILNSERASHLCVYVPVCFLEEALTFYFFSGSPSSVLAVAPYIMTGNCSNQKRGL